MTKQDIIKEGIAQTIKDDAGGYVHLMEHDRIRISKAIVGYLHSQGVVIKVDRELPEIWDGYTMDAYLLKLKKAGYVAVEPLIEARCPRCNSNKWITITETVGNTQGIRNETCPKCKGIGG